MAGSEPEPCGGERRPRNTCRDDALTTYDLRKSAGLQAATSEKCDDENREDARIRSASNAWNGECAGLPKQGANSSAYGRRSVDDRFLQEELA